MSREIVYFCAELLNYWSMTFFGLKLFAKVYEFSVHKNKNVENVIYAVSCLPISWHVAGNYFYVVYSSVSTFLIIVYMCVLIKILCRSKHSIFISLISLYVLCMRLIDLWIVAVISEVNSLSRDIYLELVYPGVGRVMFLVVLALCYYFVYKYSKDGYYIYYLKNNKIYRRVICVYSLFGSGCFSRVYLLECGEDLLRYWIFYIMCAFVFIGFFLIYVVGIKAKERERLLNMRNDMMEANYMGLQKLYKEKSALQHDHKNHMLAVSELIKENKIREALDYVQDYLVVGTGGKNEIRSGNDIINTIINRKIAETLEKGINFTYDVDYMDNLKMDNIDICALLANLLDNAVESCEKIIERETKISFKILKKNDMLIIQTKNSVSENFMKKKYLFKTDKNNSQLHGWGMHSIESVIKKYDGEKKYFISDDMIEIFITIPI